MVILYKEVMEAPMVITGRHVIINKKLTIIRFAKAVRNLVPALFGLKNEGVPLLLDAIFIS
jgi:hypothetical protein